MARKKKTTLKSLNNMNTSYKGKNLRILMGTTSIALATSCNLNINVDTADVTTKDSAGDWQDLEATVKSWTATTENLCSHGTDGADTEAMLDQTLLGTKVDVLFGEVTPVDEGVPTGGFTVNTTATDRFAYKGKAIITSIQVNAPNGERATYTATFTGAGKLEKVQPAAGE